MDADAVISLIADDETVELINGEKLHLWQYDKGGIWTGCKLGGPWQSVIFHDSTREGLIKKMIERS